MRATSPNSFRGRSNIRSKTLREAFPPAYLFMYFGPAFDLRHNHSHDASSEGGSEGEELLVGGDVLIPWVWVPAVKPQTIKLHFHSASVLSAAAGTFHTDGGISYSIGNQSLQSCLTFSMSSWQRKRSWTSLRAVGGATSLIHSCSRTRISQSYNCIRQNLGTKFQFNQKNNNSFFLNKYGLL